MRNLCCAVLLFICCTSCQDRSGSKTGAAAPALANTDKTFVTIKEKPRPKDLADIAKKLRGYITRISDRATSGDEKLSNGDSIAAINDSLRTYLTKVCLGNPATLVSSLDSTDMDIVSSRDGHVRFYSWNTWMGGSMTYNMNFAQYLDGNHLHFIRLVDTTSEDDPGWIYTGLTEIHTTDSKTVYLVTGLEPTSNKDRAVNISAYIIENDQLKPYAIFKTKTKTLSSIDYGYDSFLTYDEKQGTPDIHFSSDYTELFIPIVTGPNGDSITNSYLLYKFNGYQYVFEKKTH